MRVQEQKKVIVCLRWLVIIGLAYLILLGKEKLPSEFRWDHVFILTYILSNLVLMFLPGVWFVRQAFFYLLAVFDIGIISLGMVLSERVTTDFYLVFFLVLIIVSMSRNYKLLMALSGAISLLYGFLLHAWGLLGSEDAISYWLRIPFVFIITAFYGFIVHTFNREKQGQLAVSEARYQGLFEEANDGIIISTNGEFTIPDANREAERLTGFSKRDLQTKRIMDFFRPEAKKETDDYLREVMEKGEARTDSLPLLREDGTTVDVDWSTKRINLGETVIVQTIFRDLTEQRKLERKIRESKRSLQTLVDGIRDQLSLQSPDYEILRVNRAVADKYQTNFQELIGRRCFEAYYGRTSPCEDCPVSETVATGQPGSSVRKISGGETIFQIFSYPILDEQRNLVSVLEHTQDITEQQRLQEQLIRSEKLAGLGTLTSGFAHEINNPLSGILGMAEISMEEEDLLKIKDYLKDILGCGRKIEKTVKEFSSYSRTARGEAQTPVDVIELLENSLKMVRRMIKIPVEVIRDFQPVERVEANSGEIQLVFYHLIANALQAMKRKGGKLTLATRPLKDRIEIKVGDDGIGIPERYLSQIYDPFFTTKEVGEGKGLGLNTVYRIITKCDGTISVESKEQVGTVFTIQFPARRDL